MQHLMRAIVEMDGNSDQIEPIVQILKDQMLPYCSKREVQVEKKPPSPTPEELATEAKKKKRGSSAKKSKKSGRKDTAEDDQQQIEYETVIRPPLFSVSEVRQVSQFALQTLVQHWQLYRYVFNQSQARSLFKYTEFLEQPMPPLELKTAIDKTTWEQQKEQEKVRASKQLSSLPSAHYRVATPLFFHRISTHTTHKICRWRWKKQRDVRGKKRKKRDASHKRRRGCALRGKRKNAMLQSSPEMTCKKLHNISSTTSHVTWTKSERRW